MIKLSNILGGASSDAGGARTHSTRALRNEQRQRAGTEVPERNGREASVEERNQDMRFLQSSNASERLLWLAARRICAHIKRPISRSEFLAVGVARAFKAAITVPSSHFREAPGWIYNAYCLFIVIRVGNEIF